MTLVVSIWILVWIKLYSIKSPSFIRIILHKRNIVSGFSVSIGYWIVKAENGTYMIPSPISVLEVFILSLLLYPSVLTPRITANTKIIYFLMLISSHFDYVHLHLPVQINQEIFDTRLARH